MNDNSMVKTPYKYLMSVKKVVAVAKIRPTPIVNTKRKNSGIGEYNNDQKNGAPVTSITAMSTISDIKKLMNSEQTIPTANMYFGT